VLAGAVARSDRELVAAARAGDRTARDALVARHAPLVREVAFRYRRLGLPVEDLVQEGAGGLLAAIDDFDAERGVEFAAHAYWSVRRAMLRALTNDSRVVRVPGNVLDRRRIVRRVAEELRAATGRDPTNQEVASVLGVTAPQVAAARVAPVGVAPLEGDGTRPPVAEALADPAAQDPADLVVRAEERRRLAAALRRLPGRERTIVTGHYGVDCPPQTLAQLGARLHLSPQRTRALEQTALHRLAGELERAGVEHGS
jgi:RNA polymerase sigma factor (sigma-70 family)